MTKYFMLTPVLDIPQRKIFYIADSLTPASFLIIDDKAGGILINCPTYSEALLKEIESQGKIDYIFLPSRFGTESLQQWKAATNAESIAHEIEADNIHHPIDIRVNHKTKLTRTMDFVPMAGRTGGTCALFLKNLPGVIFLGPALSIEKKVMAEKNWPSLIENTDDASFETRMFGVLGLKDLKYDYVFTDDFNMQTCQYGPNASIEVGKNIDNYFN